MGWPACPPLLPSILDLDSVHPVTCQSLCWDCTSINPCSVPSADKPTFQKVEKSAQALVTQREKHNLFSKPTQDQGQEKQLFWIWP